jgi:molybdopterin converting factor small subunit
MTSAVPSPRTVIQVRVLLFATYADLAGQEAVDLMIEAPATVADVVRRLRDTVRGAQRIPERPLAAVNHSHARSDTPVAAGDEIALLPPLAGG